MIKGANIPRCYRLQLVVVCEGLMNLTPYVNHMVFVGPNGGRILFDKEASERFIRRVSQSRVLNNVQMVNIATELGKRGNCLKVVQYVKPKDNNYSMIAKSYGARIADNDAVKAASDYIKQSIATNRVIS